MTNRWMPRSPDNRFLETTVYRADFVPTPIHRVPKPSWHWPGHIPSAETTSSYEDAFSRNKEYARARSSHDYSRRRTHVSPHLRFAEKTTNQVELRSFVCSSPYPPHWFLWCRATRRPPYPILECLHCRTRPPIQALQRARWRRRQRTERRTVGRLRHSVRQRCPRRLDHRDLSGEVHGA
jgi:hypothetical protein